MNSAKETELTGPTHFEERALMKTDEPAEAESLWQRALRYAMIVPQFARLLLGLMLDPRVDRRVKVFAGAVFVYILSPFDFIPEAFTGIFGWADDFVLSAFAIHIILNWVDPKIVYSHWRGKTNLLSLIQKTISNAELLVPESILKKIQSWVQGHADTALQSAGGQNA
ncbi:MAG TPA: DUF1232 domain-containing protein [Acidobacteriota bacterium]|nr:DUF1232 domain-containing protein [Acidobacteriota bacterium]